MQLKYICHSAFEISSASGKIIIDPYIECNPNYKPMDIKWIFVTHGHGDHLGSAIEISKQNKSPVTAIFELANYCMQKGAFANGVSMGGKLKYPWGWVVFTPAFHSSSSPDGKYTGSPAGIMLEVDGIRIYHAGDTCLNSEMKVIKELYSPQIALLPIGGYYTMDTEQAAIAAKWLGAETIIPMHYDTFPPIKACVEQFKSMVEANGAKVEIMKYNQSISF